MTRLIAAVALLIATAAPVFACGFTKSLPILSQPPRRRTQNRRCIAIPEVARQQGCCFSLHTPKCVQKEPQPQGRSQVGGESRVETKQAGIGP